MNTRRRVGIGIFALITCGLAVSGPTATAAVLSPSPIQRDVVPAGDGLIEQVQRGDLASTQPGADQAQMPFVAVAPRRLMDTRTGLGGTSGRLLANTMYRLNAVGTATGNAEVATAVALNVTATGSSDGGFVTVWPCDAPRPGTSNVNFAAGQTIPNAVVTRISGDGQICLQASSPVHLIVDNDGWFPVGSYVQPKTPDRLTDTRGPGVLTPFTPLEVPVIGRFDIPSDAVATMLNVTVVGPTSDGYLSVYPCGEAIPNASNVNFFAGEIIPNMVLAAAGAGGKTCIISSVPTNVLVDVTAWFPAASDIRAQVPARILDTRFNRPNGAPPGKIHAGEVLSLALRSTPTTPVLPNEGAFLNVTAAEPQKGGYFTVWRCSDPRPGTSNLNFGPGITTANLVITASDAAGNICIFSDTEAYVILDVNGLFPSTASHDVPWAPVTTAGLPAANATAWTPQSTPATQAKAWENPRTNYPRGQWGYLSSAQVPKVTGQLVITAFDDRLYRCSGTVVDRDIVLTAGHCVLDNPVSDLLTDTPQRAKRVSFTPGLYGNAGLGSWHTASDIDIHPSQGFYDDLSNQTPPYQELDDTANDWALVKLAPNGSVHIGDVTGWVPVAPDLGRSPLNKVTIHYPAGGFFNAYCGTGTCMPMYCVSTNPPVYKTESFASTRRYVVGNGCPLMNGSSGGGVFSFFNGQWWVVSVVSRGADRTITGEPTAQDATNGAYTVSTVGAELNSDAYPALLNSMKAA